LNKVIPGSREVGTDVEALRGGVDVIELKAVGGSAADAASAQQLDEPGAPTVLVDLDVVLHVLCARSRHLAHRNEPNMEADPTRWFGLTTRLPWSISTATITMPTMKIAITAMPTGLCPRQTATRRGVRSVMLADWTGRVGLGRCPKDLRQGLD
jgi:hypothetical protein